MKGPTVLYRWNPAKGAVDVLYQAEHDTEGTFLYEMGVDDFLRFFFLLVGMVAAIVKNYHMVPTAKPPPPPPAKPAPPLDFPDAVQTVEDILRENEDEQSQ